MSEEPVDVEANIKVNAKPLSDALDELSRQADRLGGSLTDAFTKAALGSRELEESLRRIALSIADLALARALAPLKDKAGTLLGNLFESLSGVLPFAKGGVPGRVERFAAGGVVDGPVLFPLGRGAGLMGEAGAEAVMPLQRTADGRLGVAASGSSPVNIVFNVTAPDAASFRKSEAQITGMLARAVSRGARGL